MNIYHSCSLSSREINCFASGLSQMGDFLLAPVKSEHGGVHYHIKRDEKGQLTWTSEKFEPSSMCWLCRKICQLFGYLIKGLALLLSSELRSQYKLIHLHETTEALKAKGDLKGAEKAFQEESRFRDRLFEVKQGNKGDAGTRECCIKVGCYSYMGCCCFANYLMSFCDPCCDCCQKSLPEDFYDYPCCDEKE